MNTKISSLALLSLLSLGSQAFASSFYSIQEVASSSSSQYGPWAQSMAKDNSVASFASNTDWFSFFNMAPNGMDLAQRLRYEMDCYSQLASSVCNAFWDGSPNKALQWRYNTLGYVSQLTTLHEGVQSSEQDGVITKLGATKDQYVGYKVASAPTNSSYYHERTGFASIDGAQTELAPAYSLSGMGGFTSAYDLLPVGDMYLVAGTANTSITAPDDSFGKCYQGDTYISGEYNRCPGFNTQAAFWLVNGSDQRVTPVLSPSYYRPNDSVMQTASAMGLTALENGQLLAVGYSSTDAVGDAAASGRNVAVTWNVSVSDGVASVGTPNLIPLPKSAPGEGDKVLRNTWAVAANSQGYVIGNQKYSSAKSRNLPIEMFVYNVNTGVTTVPYADSPRGGANSEAAAINSKGQVVGWQDERSENQPVYQGSPRQQEAFLYNIGTAQGWRLNDLICSNDSGSKNCQQKGAYYYIANAVAINDDGSVAATAYRYATLDDWRLRSNPTVVSVLLSPTTAFDSNGNVPAAMVVENALPTNDYGKSNGGGSISWWLLTLMGPLVWWKRRSSVN
ncbi:MAG: DUF3466 family protein [Aeromonadaceae bacterium]